MVRLYLHDGGSGLGHNDPDIHLSSVGQWLMIVIVWAHGGSNWLFCTSDCMQS